MWVIFHFIPRSSFANCDPLPRHTAALNQKLWLCDSESNSVNTHLFKIPHFTASLETNLADLSWRWSDMTWALRRWNLIDCGFTFTTASAYAWIRCPIKSDTAINLPLYPSSSPPSKERRSRMSSDCGRLSFNIASSIRNQLKPGEKRGRNIS